MHKYKIDYSNIKHFTELYTIIYSTLDLPQYIKKDFGENLDALWDVLTGFIIGNSEFYFCGTEKLTGETKYVFDRILEVFSDACIYYSNELTRTLSFTIVN